MARAALLLFALALSGCQGSAVGEVPADAGADDAGVDASENDGAPSAWTLVYDDPTAQPEDALHDILVLASDDIWVVGKNQQILHYQGSDWHPFSQLPGVQLFGIWGSTGSDLTTTGANQFDQSPVVLNYNGSTWTSGAPFPPTLPALTDVWGIGTQRYFTGFDGQIFQDDPVKFPNDRYHLAVVTGGCPTGNEPSPNLNAIDGNTLDNILAAGDEAVLAHKDSVGWVRLCGPDQKIHYSAVFRVPNQSTFIVGSNFLGMLLFQSRKDPLLQLYQNQAIADADQAYIQRITGDAARIVGVGDHGTILFYDQASDPRLLASPTTDTLFGVGIAEPDTLYVCGRGNRIWRASLSELTATP